MGEYLVIMTRCEASIRESGKATLSRADMEAIERYNLADEHLSMMQADRIAELEAALREANRDALRMMWSAAKSNGGTLVIHRDALVKAGSGQLDRVNHLDGSIEYRAVD